MNCCRILDPVYSMHVNSQQLNLCPCTEMYSSVFLANFFSTFARCLPNFFPEYSWNINTSHRKLAWHSLFTGFFFQLKCSAVALLNMELFWFLWCLQQNWGATAHANLLWKHHARSRVSRPCRFLLSMGNTAVKRNVHVRDLRKRGKNKGKLYTKECGLNKNTKYKKHLKI